MYNEVTTPEVWPCQLIYSKLFLTCEKLFNKLRGNDHWIAHPINIAHTYC